MLTLGTSTLMCIGSSVIGEIAMIAICIGMTARRYPRIPAMLTGISYKAMIFRADTAVCTSIGTGYRFTVLFIRFLVIDRLQIMAACMFTVSTGN